MTLIVNIPQDLFITFNPLLHIAAASPSISCPVTTNYHRTITAHEPGWSTTENSTSTLFSQSLDSFPRHSFLPRPTNLSLSLSWCQLIALVSDSIGSRTHFIMAERSLSISSPSSSSPLAPPLLPLPRLSQSTFSSLPPLDTHPVSPRTTMASPQRSQRIARTHYHSQSVEEDITYSPTSPRATSPQLTRSVSPHGTRTFMKKISKWKGGHDLDFGCAGADRSWCSDGPNDLSDRYYSARGLRRNSVGSSLPSLTHSRAHSSSSDHSVSTIDSSLPPSPTPSCSSSSGDMFPPLPYTSRVPLTPRTAKRKSDEVAAIDALNEYFVRVRLSRVDEDSPRSSQTAFGLGVSANTKMASEHDFEIEFLTTGHSTFTPLSPSTSLATFYPSPPLLESCSINLSAPRSDSGRSFDSGSGGSTIPGHSPIPDSDITGTLEELSEYFLRPTYGSRSSSSLSTSTSSSSQNKSLPSSPSGHQRSSSTVLPQRMLDRRARPRFASEGGQMTVDMASVVRSGSVRLGDVPPALGRAPYGWI